jgi:hypothetical protein
MLRILTVCTTRKTRKSGKHPLPQKVETLFYDRNYTSKPASKHIPLLSASDQDMTNGQTVGFLCTCMEISTHPL